MSKLCAVFVCDKEYFSRFAFTCSQLVTKGNYKGDICLVIGDDLRNNPMLDCDVIKNNNVIVQYFQDITVSQQNLVGVNNNISVGGRKINWQKFHIFNTFFKKWDYVFYLDSGLTIFSDISPMIAEAKENTMLAHAGAGAANTHQLREEFDQTQGAFATLNETYNLNVNSFQANVMLYDTKLIQQGTFRDIYNLALKYPISKTNEQGIISLYFASVKPSFAQIKLGDENINYYDYIRVDHSKPYIILCLF
jgi:hypothetical protein